MRKLLFALLLSTLFTTVTSAPIDEQSARLRALQFLAAKGITMPSTAKMTRAAISVRQSIPFKRAGATPFYVFNGDHGFAIVSGDDRTAPVLGYSLTSTFSWDDAPDNLKAWLQGYADQITALQNGDAKTRANTVSPGEGIASRPTIPSMTKALWDQNVPYNRHCPKSPSGYDNTVTGCVATAMAELLYYHWQKTPGLMAKATLAAMPAYETDTAWPDGKRINVKGIPQGSEIDWTNMQPVYRSSAYTDVQAEAVANLMLYCGVSVYMDYASGASGANAFHVPNALIKYFGFDSATRTIDHSNYSVNEWNRIIYDELAAGRPVFYSGEAGGMNGHAFVIDGYAGNNYFRVNWGWSGAGNDGAYLLSILEPEATGTGAGNSKGGYNQLMRAVIGAKPATVNSQQDKIPNIMTQNFNVDGDKLSISFVNGRDDWQDADVGFAYRATDGKLQMIEMKHFKMGPPYKLYYAPYSFDCTLSSRSDGKYDIVPIARTQSDKEWQSLWSADKYVEVTIEGGHVTDYTIKPTPSVELSELSVGDIALTGFALPVTFTAKGTGPDGLAQNIYMFASTTSVKSFWKTEQLVVVGNGESKFFNMTWTPDKPGTYTIWICADREGQQVIGKLTNVKIQQGRGSISKLFPNFATLMNVSVNNSQKNRSVDAQGRLVTPVGTNNLYGSFSVKLNRGLGSTVSTALYKYNSATGEYEFFKTGDSGLLPAGSGVPYNGRISFPGLADGTYLFVVGLGIEKVAKPLAHPEKLYWYNDAYCFTIGQTTDIHVPSDASDAMVPIYTLRGMKVATVKRSEVFQYLQTLPHGIYIVDGKKIGR